MTKLSAFAAVDYIEALGARNETTFTANKVEMADDNGVRVAYVTFVDASGREETATVWHEETIDALYGEW